MQLRIQHIVFNLPERQHSAQQFTDFHRSGTYQHRSPLPYQRHYLVNHRVIFLSLRAVDTVVHIDTRNRSVGRDYHYIQFVDIPELTCLGLRRTRHTRQLVVHAEVVLQGDGSKGLGSAFHLHILLRLDGLVQPIGPSAAFHHTPRLLVDYLHLIVIDDIVHIFLKQRVGFQQLVHGVYALGLDAVVRHYFVLLLLLLLLRQLCLVLYICHLASDIRQDEEVRVFRGSRERVDTLVRQFDGFILLVYHEVQLIGGDVHVLLVLLQVELLGLL